MRKVGRKNRLVEKRGEMPEELRSATCANATRASSVGDMTSRDAPSVASGGILEGTPAGILAETPAFCDLVATEHQLTAFNAALSRAACGGTDISELSLGFVARLDRGFPVVVCASGMFRAEFAARLTKGFTGKTRAAVGDWVVARLPQQHDMGLIEEILPRTSDVARWRGGARGGKQTLAANVDVVLVVQQVGKRELSIEQIVKLVKLAVVARDCKTEVAVVLTKADRASNEVLTHDIALVRDVLGETCPLALTSSVACQEEVERCSQLAVTLGVPWGKDTLRVLVPVGTLAIVLGESGAGKSTLLNELLGREALETQSVRSSDDKGRHTTVARCMIKVPDAGVIIDEPGLRSLQLVGHERGLALVFPEIASAACHCRFRDCTHTREPGCAVLAAHHEGAFSDTRLACYCAIADSMRRNAQSLDPDVVI